MMFELEVALGIDSDIEEASNLWLAYTRKTCTEVTDKLEHSQ
jgi:hypothetical protein